MQILCKGIVSYLGASQTNLIDLAMSRWFSFNALSCFLMPGQKLTINGRRRLTTRVDSEDGVKEESAELYNIRCIAGYR